MPAPAIIGVIVTGVLAVGKSVLSDLITKIITESELVKQLMEELKIQAEDLLAAWEGDDAEAFVYEMRETLSSDLQRLIAVILGMRIHYEDAVQLVDETDFKAAETVQDVADAFSKI